MLRWLVASIVDRRLQTRVMGAVLVEEASTTALQGQYVAHVYRLLTTCKPLY